MITIRPELECILPMIMDGIADETLSKLHPVLREQYIWDLGRRFQPNCRVVHPDEAEGYEDISELDDYMVVITKVPDLKLSIEKTPLYMKEIIENQRKRLHEWYDHCDNCNHDCSKCQER